MIDLSNRLKLKFFYKNIVLLTFIATIFFIISFLYVEKLRDKNFSLNNSNENIIFSKNFFKMLKVNQLR